MHVPAKVNGKADGKKQRTREIKAQVREKEEWPRYRQLGSSGSLEEFMGPRSMVKKEFVRAKRARCGTGR